jgi:hypothetical protein
MKDSVIPIVLKKAQRYNGANDNTS